MRIIDSQIKKMCESTLKLQIKQFAQAIIRTGPIMQITQNRYEDAFHQKLVY